MKYALLSIVLLFSTLFVLAQTPAQTIPVFTLYKLDKTTFTNADLASRKMLFFFLFDPACEHCQHAAENLNKKYTDFSQAAIYLVSADSKEKIVQFTNQYLPAFNNKKNVTVLQDVNNEFVTKFQPLRYPAMFLYTPNKKLTDYEDNAESVFRFSEPLQQNQNQK